MTDGQTGDALALLGEALTRGHSIWWRPRGFSMRPVIQDGDRVLVAPARPENLRLGDVVQYAWGDGVRIHRIVRRRRGDSGALEFVCDGDSSESPPEVVPAGAVQGRIVAVERGGRVRRLDSLAARMVALVRVWKRRVSVVRRE